LKKRLFTPGPTPLPKEVIRAMMQPMVHHRWPECAQLLQQVRQGLQYALQTQNEIVILTCSGTGAMEASMANLHRPGDKILVAQGGKFGQRWTLIGQAYGLQVTLIETPWGEALDPQLVAQHLEEDPNIRAVYLTLCETSTGVANDLQALSEMVSSHPALLVVDAVSGLCSQELLTDRWQVDVVVSATQKGLMCPPGISFVSLNKAAGERVSSATLPRFYWDFREMRKFSEKNQTPYTPAITTLYGLKAALNLIHQEGLENVIRRHARLARMARAGVTALNLELFAQRPANALTAVRVPPNMDGIKLLRILHDRLGAVVAGGQSRLRGKIFRLAHLGYVDELDVIAALAALENALHALGHKFTIGEGLQAAQGLFSDPTEDES
jgi:aspartate aminotransferase-like enzyme